MKSKGCPGFADMDAYIRDASPEVRAILEEIRGRVKDAIPEAVEAISYKMPAFQLGRVFIYFAAFRKHIGIYPPVKGDKKLQRDLLPYRGVKGNLKFPLDEPVPYDLIVRVAMALSEEYGKR